MLMREKLKANDCAKKRKALGFNRMGSVSTIDPWVALRRGLTQYPFQCRVKKGLPPPSLLPISTVYYYYCIHI